MSLDFEEQVLKMQSEGVGRQEIAKRLGTTEWQVRKIVGKAPMATGPKGAMLNPDDPVLRGHLVHRLRAGWLDPAEEAAGFGASTTAVKAVIAHLDKAGYNVQWQGGRARIESGVPIGGGEDIKDASPLVGEEKAFGVVSDTHLCNRSQRLDVLEAAYNHWAKLGITHVYHAGNIVDGECRFNRYDLLAHGITDQTAYCLDHYPQRSGMKTYFITADDHEGWWMQREGIDFGKYLVQEARDFGRDDLVWIGYQESDVEFRQGRSKGFVRVVHPGGGTAYALSYSTQKIVESLQGGEKPGLMLTGHYHKAVYHMVRNVHVIQCGTTCDQTVWMRKKKLEAHVGFWTVRIRQDGNGSIREVTPTFTAFYDRSYHVGARFGDGE